MHAVYEGVEKEAEDDPGKHQSGLDQQPPVGDVILQQQYRFSVTSNHENGKHSFLLSGIFEADFCVHK